MTTTITLPAHIEARNIGVYPETDYDEFGELAPITWVCGCGSRLKLAHYSVSYDRFDEIEDEGYVEVPQERKDAFLAKHADCKPLCFRCRKVPVDIIDGWCDPCNDADLAR